MWTTGEFLEFDFGVDATFQTSQLMKVRKYYSYVTLSLLRYSVLILDKVVMGSLNMEHAVDPVFMRSYSPSFDPTIDNPPDYSLLSPFASNGGY